jgi:hypothetical protein
LQEKRKDPGVTQAAIRVPRAMAASRSGQGSFGSSRGTSSRMLSTKPSSRSALFLTCR